jgi:single-stranded-DNA-specific exonuclease
LAAHLELLNRQRRDVESAALTLIETRLAADADFAATRLLLVDGDGWHRGVIGILASRVVERTAKPAIVVSVEDGVAYGSGRSVDGFPLLEAIETCGDLFTRFGGHAFAVGFAMPATSIPELRRRLNLHAEERLGLREPEQLLRIHAELPLDRITTVLAGWLRKMEPLGHGNLEPIFIARKARLAAPPRVMKDRHIRLELMQESVARAGVVRAVGWDWAARCLALELPTCGPLDVAYRIRENTHPDYGGIEIEIAGIRPAEA